MDDIQTEIYNIRRAPISKKLKSEAKLAEANKFFNDMLKKLDIRIRFSAEKYGRYKLIECSKGPTLLL
jgi:hypothetical protein